MNQKTNTSISNGRLARLVAGITLALLATLAPTGCGRQAGAPTSPTPTSTLVPPMPLMAGPATISSADQRITATAVQPETRLKARLFCAPNLIGPCVSNGIGVTQGYLVPNLVNPTPDHRHAGIDFGGSYTVYAPVAGRVVRTGACGLIEIEDSRRIDGGAAPRHIMLHMKDIQVSGGQSVRVGTVLGVSSNVSYPAGGCVATGIHLHYEIRRNYTGTSAVGPTSCGSERTCSTASLTYDPLGFPF